MEFQDSKLVHTVSKNSGEQICFYLKQQKEQAFADIRIWFRKTDSDELFPTKKGVFFPMNLFDEVLRGMELLRGGESALSKVAGSKNSNIEKHR